MDAHNTFETPTTYRALRAEYALLMGASAYVLWRNRKKVRWPVAAALFYYNDALGYIPGAIAYRRSPDKRISKAYYVTYNVAHSAVTASIVAALWAKLVKPEWALAAIPFHIGIDRSVFGNFLKPFSVPFEPEPHPVWARVKDQLAQPAPGAPAAVTDGDGTARSDTDSLAQVGSAAS
ncbi:MAG: hypothetical protein M3N16_00040 [Actinomycetota bacterium]|nr:hypothetical protein [Actinomycetota bacterium]